MSEVFRGRVISSYKTAAYRRKRMRQFRVSAPRPKDAALTVRGYVRCFDTEKGYGFLSSDLGDILIRKDVLLKLGGDSMVPGTMVECEVFKSPKGWRVLRITTIDKAQSEWKYATLKWFDCDRGFGFCVLETDGTDVFLHASVLKNSHIDALEPGSRVRIRIAERSRGKIVVDIRSIPAA